jgi:hypothetical protein
MKIAQIAPLIESVPPRLYGGTERIVSYLADELVRSGHDVTLFASGDSVTSASLVSCTRTALRLDRNVRDPIPSTRWLGAELTTIATQELAPYSEKDERRGPRQRGSGFATWRSSGVKLQHVGRAILDRSLRLKE